MKAKRKNLSKEFQRTHWKETANVSDNLKSFYDTIKESLTRDQQNQLFTLWLDVSIQRDKAFSIYYGKNL